MVDNFSELIGVPQSLKSTLVASVRDNSNFESIKNLIFDNPEGYVKEIFINLPIVVLDYCISLQIFSSPRDGGYGHGGCNSDAFAVFGFLAFLLAAANLFMQNNAGGGRKRRL